MVPQTSAIPLTVHWSTVSKLGWQEAYSVQPNLGCLWKMWWHWITKLKVTNLTQEDQRKGFLEEIGVQNFWVCPCSEAMKLCVLKVVKAMSFWASVFLT